METATPSNQYVINNVQQLFALNTNLVNFQSKFMVKSLSNEPFMGLVVNQQALDSGQALEFRNADQGVFSGEIIQDNNIPGNWYLVLKSPKPNKVSVDIQTFPVAPRPQQPAESFALTGRDSGPTANTGIWDSIKSLSGTTKIIIGVVILGIVFYFGRKYYISYKERQQDVGFDDLYTPSGYAPMYAPPMPPKQMYPSPAPESAPPVVSTPAPEPAPPVVSTPAPAPASVPKGTTTQDILGADLISKVNELPKL
jgi:hypothetical protein